MWFLYSERLNECCENAAILLRTLLTSLSRIKRPSKSPLSPLLMSIVRVLLKDFILPAHRWILEVGRLLRRVLIPEVTWAMNKTIVMKLAGKLYVWTQQRVEVEPVNSSDCFLTLLYIVQLVFSIAKHHPSTDQRKSLSVQSGSSLEL